MPFGRPRRSSSAYRAVDKLTAKRKPHGFSTWLAFAAETFVPPPYFTQSPDGRRYRVLNQDAASVRRVMAREVKLMKLVAEGAVASAIQAASERMFLLDAAHIAWNKAQAAPSGSSPNRDVYSDARDASELLEKWLTWTPETGLTWTSLPCWKKEHAEWLKKGGEK